MLRFTRLMGEKVRLQREHGFCGEQPFSWSTHVQPLNHAAGAGTARRLSAELQERELEAEARCLELERRVPAMLEDMAASAGGPQHLPRDGRAPGP